MTSLMISIRLIQCFFFSITLRNYATHTDIRERYAVHLMKTRKKSIFIISSPSPSPPLFYVFFYLQE